jgi:hypothetical protein
MSVCRGIVKAGPSDPLFGFSRLLSFAFPIRVGPYLRYRHHFLSMSVLYYSPTSTP